MREKLVDVYEALKKRLFIVISSLSILIALYQRNLLIWHLEQFWGASKSLWSTIWGVFYWMSGESFFNMYVFGSWMLFIFVFAIANTFFMILDLTGKPAALLKYKIQKDQGVPVNWGKYKKALWRCAFNSVIMRMIFNLVTYPLAVWRGIDAGYELPSFATTVCHFFGFIVALEIGIYYTHRMFHHPTLYKYIHKTHHEWTAPTGIVSFYAHPLEYFVSDLVSLGLGPWILGSHISITWLWYTLSIWNSIISHCGYHLPFLPSSEFHDYHHLKFNQNYGVMGVLDRLHGTDNVFRQSKNYKRHFMLLGLNPAQ